MKDRDLWDLVLEVGVWGSGPEASGLKRLDFSAGEVLRVAGVIESLSSEAQ